MTDKKKPDPIKDFLNLPDNIPGEPPDIVPNQKPVVARKPMSPLEQALMEEDNDDNDLTFVKNAQKDIIAKGVEMMGTMANMVEENNDIDTHMAFLEYVKQMSSANKALMAMKQSHQATQESKARMKKINADNLRKNAGLDTDDDSDKKDRKMYNIKTTSSEMLKMVKELQAEEDEKRRKKSPTKK